MADTPAGYRRNAAGDLIAAVNIKPEHLLEDELVLNLIPEAQALADALAAFREKTLSEIAAYQELVASKYGVTRNNPEGNITLSAFDGSAKVERVVAKSISFGPELQAAKALIDACVTRWSEGANANLLTFVFDAFQIDRKGKISTDKVLGLRRLAIDDPEWARAMEAISDAVRVTGSKTYARFYRRAGDASVLIALDLANAEGVADA